MIKKLLNSWYNTVRDKVIKMKHPKSYDSDEKTRKRMSLVHLKGGKAEVLLAKRLWHEGIRYRKNYKKLPGSPDIVLTKRSL